MKKNVLVASAFLVALAMTGCSNKNEEASKEKLPELSQEALIAKGKYLVRIGGCNDCHSPKMMTPFGPEPDTTRLLSGHIRSEVLPPIGKNDGKDGWVKFNMNTTAYVGPWGVSFAANLTPDDTGIGNWNYDQFKTAIQKGKYKGLENSRTLLPPMPWQMYKDLKEDDLKAIFAYLKSLPPVSNLVPQPISSIQ